MPHFEGPRRFMCCKLGAKRLQHEFGLISILVVAVQVGDKNRKMRADCGLLHYRNVASAESIDKKATAYNAQ